MDRVKKVQKCVKMFRGHKLITGTFTYCSNGYLNTQGLFITYFDLVKNDKIFIHTYIVYGSDFTCSSLNFSMLLSKGYMSELCSTVYVHFLRFLKHSNFMRYVLVSSSVVYPIQSLWICLIRKITYLKQKFRSNLHKLNFLINSSFMICTILFFYYCPNSH